MKKLFFIIMVLLFSIPAFSQKRDPRTKEEVLNEKYSTGLFSTLNADYFDLLNDNNTASSLAYLNVLDWLQGRVAGLQIYSTRSGIRIPFIRNQRAGVFVDEMWVGYDYLNMLPVTDIAMIKVIRGPFLGGRGASGGAIAIYTIRGDDDEENTEQ